MIQDMVRQNKIIIYNTIRYNKIRYDTIRYDTTQPHLLHHRGTGPICKTPVDIVRVRVRV